MDGFSRRCPPGELVEWMIGMMGGRIAEEKARNAIGRRKRRHHWRAERRGSMEVRARAQQPAFPRPRGGTGTGRRGRTCALTGLCFLVTVGRQPQRCWLVVVVLVLPGEVLDSLTAFNGVA